MFKNMKERENIGLGKSIRGEKEEENEEKVDNEE